MSIQSAYDAMLEDMQCPNPDCGHVGMLPNGDFDWVCPECGCEGTFEDDYD